jgi:hypothetical protein
VVGVPDRFGTVVCGAAPGGNGVGVDVRTVDGSGPGPSGSIRVVEGNEPGDVGVVSVASVGEVSVGVGASVVRRGVGVAVR